MSQDSTAENAAVELAEPAGAEAVSAVDDSKSTPQDRVVNGPFDLSEVPVIKPYVDFGAIKVAPREGLHLRLEVDERAKRVVAVTLEFAGSTLQVQAFSAPKSSGLWNRVRGEIAEQLGAQGASVEQLEGAFGPELAVTTQVPEAQGGGSREVRFFAVDGPRWMLRGVLMGQAVSDQIARSEIDAIYRDMVVVRGDQPMPPSELLPLQVPAGVASETVQQA